MLRLAELHLRPVRRIAAAALAAVALLVGLPGVVEAQTVPKRAEAQAEAGRLQVYAHHLEHRSTRFVIDHIRPLLSARGTVEEQPQHNNLIVRDTAGALQRIRPLIERLDAPLRDMRLEIQVIEAGPRRPSVISPVAPPAPGDGPVVDERLPDDFAERILPLLRYDEYRVLAQAGMSSKEGEDVVYTLGDGYAVSFRVGSVVSDKRLQLQGFRVFKQNLHPNKGRQLEPDELFQGTLNLWTDRPFTLVLTQDKKRQEALMVAISAFIESDADESGADDATPPRAAKPNQKPRPENHPKR